MLMWVHLRERKNVNPALGLHLELSLNWLWLPRVGHRHRPSTTSAINIHWPLPNSADLHRFHLKDVIAPIYWIVWARFPLKVVTILLYSCIWSRYSKFSLFAMFFVCQKSETFCEVLAKNKNKAAEKRDRLGYFLVESWQAGKKFLYCYLFGTVMVTIGCQWSSAETQCHHGSGNLIG